jgi:hypothetical protein
MTTPTLNTDIRQRHLEAFEHEYNTVETARGTSTLAGAVVRAAAAAGWFAAPLTPEEIADMKPAQVRALATAVNELYGKVTTVEKN